eukprot:8791470-Prorocentrum_lima.AAC.1
MIGDKTSVVICGNLPAHVHFAVRQQLQGRHGRSGWGDAVHPGHWGNQCRSGIEILLEFVPNAFGVVQ